MPLSSVAMVFNSAVCEIIGELFGEFARIGDTVKERSQVK